MKGPKNHLKTPLKYPRCHYYSQEPEYTKSSKIKLLSLIASKIKILSKKLWMLGMGEWRGRLKEQEAGEPLATFV